MMDGAFSTFKSILAGVSEGSLLGPLLYVLYTVMMAEDASQSKATEKLRLAANKIYEWT